MSQERARREGVRGARASERKEARCDRTEGGVAVCVRRVARTETVLPLTIDWPVMMTEAVPTTKMPPPRPSGKAAHGSPPIAVLPLMIDCAMMTVIPSTKMPPPCCRPQASQQVKGARGERESVSAVQCTVCEREEVRCDDMEGGIVVRVRRDARWRSRW